MEMLGAIMTFGAVLFGLLALYMPIAQMNMDQYAVRVRPRKKVEIVAGEVQKESVLLTTLKSIGDSVIGALPQVIDERSKVLLMHANYRTPAHLSTFIGVKTVAVVVVEFLVIFSGMDILLKVVALGGAAFVAWTMPNFFLSSRVKRRQNQILRELPTVIDLLIVCAQAGLGLIVCIDKVQKEVRDTCPELTSELEQMIQDVKVFAKSVPVALKDMGERCGVEDITQLASSLISAESKGSDISYPLRQQAIALRDKLKRKKEEEASKTPVKMVPVIMAFVMPLILCPMLGPAIITIMTALQPMMNPK
ncbi:MAG: type II secretion system F family protein [Candidatus Obscuribacterales bacterium]|nr:type II secretion system F family protein [Candidatus Obscuribacterales bacterium]